MVKAATVLLYVMSMCCKLNLKIRSAAVIGVALVATMAP